MRNWNSDIKEGKFSKIFKNFLIHFFSDSPDVIIDYDRFEGYIPDQSFDTIETLLPMPSKSQNNFLYLNAHQNIVSREGWTFITQN